MANHKSAEKRIRQAESRRLRNRYVGRTTRNSVKGFRGLTDKAEAEKLFPEVCSKLDKLVKKNIIHKNKAANLKSSLSAHMKSL